MKIKITVQGPGEDDYEYKFYVYVLAANIPPLIFNKNTSVTNAIRIELSTEYLKAIPTIPDKIIIHDKYKEIINLENKSRIREMDIYSQLYLFGIYTSFKAKIFFIRNYKLDMFKDVDATIRQYGEQIPKTNIINTKISVINLICYFSDNLILYNEQFFGVLKHIYDHFAEEYMKYFILLIKLM